MCIRDSHGRAALDAPAELADRLGGIQRDHLDDVMADLIAFRLRLIAQKLHELCGKYEMCIRDSRSL